MLRRAQKIRQRYVNPVPTALFDLSTLLKLLPLYLRNKEERVPRTPVGPFQTDALVYAQAPESGLRVTWMGHSTMLVEIDGVRVLIDPVWDERASPVRWAGPKRFFAAPLRLDELPEIDVVIVSHDHYDHLGKATIQRLAHQRTGSKWTPRMRWVTSKGVGSMLRKFGVEAGRITELDWTESVSLQGQSGRDLKITALPARHFSGRGLGNRFETLWSSFVLKGVEHTVYFGADSGWWEGFVEIGASYGPFDLTMLEIGAYHELWSSIHMGPDGAGQAFSAIGGGTPGHGGMLMPIHWGLFDLALHGWRQPIQRMVEVADELGIELWSPEPGLPTEVVRGVEVRSNWWR